MAICHPFFYFSPDSLLEARLGEHWGPLVLTDTPKSELGEHEGPLVLTEVLCQGEGWF